MEDGQADAQPGEMARRSMQHSISDKIHDLARRCREHSVSNRTHVSSTSGQEPDFHHSDVAPPLANRQDGTAVTHFDESDVESRQFLSAAAAEIYRMRRARDHVLPSELTGEPGWDMLLALYSEEPAGMTVSSLCHGSGVPHTTAMRWIRTLEHHKLVERVEHPRDQNLILLSLTPAGRELVECALKAMLRAFGFL